MKKGLSLSFEESIESSWPLGLSLVERPAHRFPISVLDKLHISENGSVNSNGRLVVALDPGSSNDGAVQGSVLSLAVELVAPEFTLVDLSIRESVLAGAVLPVSFPLAIVEASARIEADSLSLPRVVDEVSNVELAIRVPHDSSAVSLVGPETRLALVRCSVSLIGLLDDVGRKLRRPAFSIEREELEDEVSHGLRDPLWQRLHHLVLDNCLFILISSLTLAHLVEDGTAGPEVCTLSELIAESLWRHVRLSTWLVRQDRGAFFWKPIGDPEIADFRNKRTAFSVKEYIVWLQIRMRQVFCMQ